MDPRTFFLTVSNGSLISLPSYVPRERNIGELFVEKTVPVHQVVHRLPQCECGEEENHKDQRCEDAFHQVSLGRNEKQKTITDL